MIYAALIQVQLAAKAGSGSKAVHIENVIDLAHCFNVSRSGFGGNITHRATIEGAVMYAKGQKEKTTGEGNYSDTCRLKTAIR